MTSTLLIHMKMHLTNENVCFDRFAVMHRVPSVHPRDRAWTVGVLRCDQLPPYIVRTWSVYRWGRKQLALSRPYFFIIIPSITTPRSVRPRRTCILVYRNTLHYVWYHVSAVYHFCTMVQVWWFVSYSIEIHAVWKSFDSWRRVHSCSFATTNQATANDIVLRDHRMHVFDICPWLTMTKTLCAF